MRKFGIIIVCLGLLVMLAALVHGVAKNFSVPDWAGIGVGAWFSLIGCILIPSKKRN